MGVTISLVPLSDRRARTTRRVTEVGAIAVTPLALRRWRSISLEKLR